MILEIIITAGIVLLFVLGGLILNWTLASVGIIVIIILTVIAYTVLKLIEKRKQKRLIINYDESKNESGRTKDRGEIRIGNFERTEPNPFGESSRQEPGTDQPSIDIRDADNKDGNGETETRHKPNRFTPV